MKGLGLPLSGLCMPISWMVYRLFDRPPTAGAQKVA
jgi:hypothetical protein